MLRLGIVDFDSSHAAEFARRLNGVGVDADQRVEGARVVCGWPGSSEMAPERIAGVAAQVAACGVELVDVPEAMLGRVDGVLVLSLCGRAHRERVEPFLDARVPVFVDKPMACSLSDAAAMFAHARRAGVPLWSSSALRFAEETLAFRTREREHGPLHGAVAYGPAWLAAGNPGLFHYGIHAVELLCAVMGRGAEGVEVCHSDREDLVTVRRTDGRTAVVRGTRAGATAYGFLAFCERAVVPVPVSTRYAYRNLCRAIVESFATARPGVPPEETLEVIALIEAALTTERDGGRTVRIADKDVAG